MCPHHLQEGLLLAQAVRKLRSGYVQRCTGKCDAVGHVRMLAVLADCDPSARLDQNILKWRNDLSGRILSFHTGWAGCSCSVELSDGPLSTSALISESRPSFCAVQWSVDDPKRS